METPVRLIVDGDAAPYHLLRDSDDSRLNQLGYKQELSRSLSEPTFRFTVSSIAVGDSVRAGLASGSFVNRKQNTRAIANFSVTFSIISVMTGITTLYSQGLSFGGPVTMVYGWPIVGLMTLLVGLSLAEICSAYPTSGGLYFWSAKLCGRDLATFASWITGCVVGTWPVIGSILLTSEF